MNKYLLAGGSLGLGLLVGGATATAVTPPEVVKEEVQIPIEVTPPDCLNAVDLLAEALGDAVGYRDLIQAAGYAANDRNVAELNLVLAELNLVLAEMEAVDTDLGDTVPFATDAAAECRDR